MTARRRATATSAFGVGRRENHDSSDFYARFTPPVVSKDETVNPPKVVDTIVVGDARSMSEVADASVALVVTSPPYFAGKEYETALGQGHIPASYLDYLRMLEGVFAECVRVLEPGGRIAVNVANLGRKPYRSLSSDVVAILQDRLGLLLRGEIVWQKARGASGNCAWGSFLSASNPALRDVTERVIVAGKGRFDRAVKRPERAKQGLPSVATIATDEFMEATLDVWEIAPESATRVGHPAPFPVELPRRLIELYTYEGDLVLDPFMGSGSTAVAAVRSGRHYVGYDTDPEYVAAAEARVAQEGREAPKVGAALDVAKSLLGKAGFELHDTTHLNAGDIVARVTGMADLHVLVAGRFGTVRSGLTRTDVLWRTLGRIKALEQRVGAENIVVLATELPEPGSPASNLLRSLRDSPFPPVLLLDDPSTPAALRSLRRKGGRSLR